MRSCRWLLRETKPRPSLAGQSARWPWLGGGEEEEWKEGGGE